MSSVFDQSLQIALQEPTTLGVLATLSVGVVGMSIRRIVESVVADEASVEEDSPEATERDAPGRVDAGEQLRPVTDGAGTRGNRNFEPPAAEGQESDELEHRLNHLEAEVDDLSTTVEAVQHENEQIAESVEDVNSHLQRLVDLSGSVAQGVNPFSNAQETTGQEPTAASEGQADASSDGAVEQAGENRHTPVQYDKVERIPAGTSEAGGFDPQEDEVEELETVSFSNDTDEEFGASEEELGTEEVIAEQEPAPEAETLVDGGTLIETVEEELDIEPGSVSDTAKTADTAPRPDPADVAESGFEFGAKAPDGETAENTSGAETQAPEGDDDTTDLDAETEAELAAAEAAFADELAEESTRPPAFAEELAQEAPAEPEATNSPAGDTEMSRPVDLDPPPDDTAADSPAGAATHERSTEESMPTTADEQESAGTDASQAEPGTSPASPSDPGMDAMSDRSLAPSMAGETKPYVARLPKGYSAEILIVEWVEYLVEHVGVHGAMRAIDYYQSIDWITEDVAEELDEYLHGFGHAESDRLSVDEHMESLEYVDELAASGSLTAPPEDDG